jgi:transposase
MGAAVAITRLDLTAGELRRAARKEKNGTVARRILALALVLEGSDRKKAAESCGMDRQTLRDWMHRYNAEGLAELQSRQLMGPRSRLTTEQQPELAALVEAGPDPEQHGVVRWRVDLRDELERWVGVKLHERSVGKVLAKLGYRRLSVRPRHPLKRFSKRLKKLCCDPHDNTPRSRPSQADRNLVPGRGADRPAGHADTRVG